MAISGRTNGRTQGTDDQPIKSLLLCNLSQ